MKDFRTLKIWQKAHQLALAVYKATGGFPRHELFGLTSQMRRSSQSIPTNIAEGCGRQGDAEFARFPQIGMGSASELEYQLVLAHDLGFLGPDTYDSLCSELVEVRRMLNVLIQRVRPAEPTRAAISRRGPELTANG